MDDGEGSDDADKLESYPVEDGSNDPPGEWKGVMEAKLNTLVKGLAVWALTHAF